MEITRSIDLPHEVLQHIMAYLHELDPLSLRACAAVSRAWLWPARTHLFAHVHVKDGRAWDGLRDAFASASALAPLVRTLSVSDHKDFLCAAVTQDKDVGTVLAPAVSGLRLLNMSGAIHPVSDWLDAVAPNARSLRMERVQFRTCADFFHAISVRPYIHELSLVDVSHKAPVHGLVLDAPRLEVLNIDSHTVHILTDAPDATLNMRPREMTVSFMHEDAVPPLAGLLRRIGSALESFSMSIHEAIQEPLIWQELPAEDAFLSHSPHLRYLHLVNITHNIYRLGPNLHGVLSALASSSIETLALQLRIRRKQELVLQPSDAVQDAYPCLRELNALFDGPRFAHLRRMHVDVHFAFASNAADWWSATTPAQLEAGVAELFPVLAARGVLVSTFHDPTEKDWKGDVVSVAVNE